MKKLTIFQRFSVLKRESLGKMHKKVQFREKNLFILTMDFYLTFFLKCDIMEISGAGLRLRPGQIGRFMGIDRAMPYNI